MQLQRCAITFLFALFQWSPSLANMQALTRLSIFISAHYNLRTYLLWKMQLFSSFPPTVKSLNVSFTIIYFYMKLVLSPEGDRSVRNTDGPPAAPELGETSVACVVFCIQYVCIHMSEHMFFCASTNLFVLNFCYSFLVNSALSVYPGEVQVLNHTKIQFK